MAGAGAEIAVHQGGGRARQRGLRCRALALHRLPAQLGQVFLKLIEAVDGGLAFKLLELLRPRGALLGEPGQGVVVVDLVVEFLPGLLIGEPRLAHAFDALAELALRSADQRPKHVRRGRYMLRSQRDALRGDGGVGVEVDSGHYFGLVVTSYPRARRAASSRMISASIAASFLAMYSSRALLERRVIASSSSAVERADSLAWRFRRYSARSTTSERIGAPDFPAQSCRQHNPSARVNFNDSRLAGAMTSDSRGGHCTIGLR